MIEIKSNVPPSELPQKVKLYFDSTYTAEIPSDQYDSITAYFLARGFDKVAASSVAALLIQQSKTENINVQKLLDTLKGISDVQVSVLVAGILNRKRPATSKIGYKATNLSNTQVRNILP